jgi:hypothetical protein
MKTDILALYSMFLPSMIRLYDITFDRHDITEILLKVALNTITLTQKVISYSLIIDGRNIE